ncbi:hypothetical protein AB0N09_05410 [Streptomyces erythrochromogenes]|uniref:hypothetical protein n=1 Tax=Streptomyces erythrochromogenes TaxID=285574 RepID=UPI00342F163A
MTNLNSGVTLETLTRQEPGLLLDEAAWPHVGRALQARLDLTDPHPVLAAAESLAVGPLAAALAAAVKESVLTEPTGRRVPLQEIPSRMLTPLSRAHRLSPAETAGLHFALRCAYAYPGPVGTPWAPLALKEELPPGYTPFATPAQIAAWQAQAGPDGLNTRYLVSQMKGGMSVDCGIECPAGCAYCYRREGDTVEGYVGTWEPGGFLEADEAIERLLAHPWFTPHITPIGLHMSTSEAFLPALWSRTWGMLQRLDELGLTNRVSCITKYSLPEAKIEMLESLTHVDLDINVCYAAMPEAIEPPNRKRRIDFLARILTSDKLNVLAYYRPIAEGLNTTDAHLRHVWEVFKEAGARTVVLGGLKFSGDHARSFMEYGLPLPSGSFTAGKKLLTAATEARIMAAFDQVYASVPDHERPAVLKRSSCGRSVERGHHLPDYNAHHDLPATNCRLRCPSAQHQQCAATTTPTAREVAQLLERIDRAGTRFDITPLTTVIHADLSQFERTFLRQNLLAPVHTARQAAALVSGRIR